MVVVVHFPRLDPAGREAGNCISDETTTRHLVALVIVAIPARGSWHVRAYSDISELYRVDQLLVELFSCSPCSTMVKDVQAGTQPSGVMT